MFVVSQTFPLEVRFAQMQGSFLELQKGSELLLVVVLICWCTNLTGTQVTPMKNSVPAKLFDH